MQGSGYVHHLSVLAVKLGERLSASKIDFQSQEWINMLFVNH